VRNRKTKHKTFKS